MNTEFQKIIDLTSEPRDTNEPHMPEERLLNLFFPR